MSPGLRVASPSPAPVLRGAAAVSAGPSLPAPGTHAIRKGPSSVSFDVIAAGTKTAPQELGAGVGKAIEDPSPCRVRLAK